MGRKTTPAVAPILHEDGKRINRNLPGQAKPLEKWHMAYAEWDVTRGRGNLPESQHLAQASLFAGRAVTAPELRSLRYRSVAYKQYRTLVSNSEYVQAARKRFEAMMLPAVDAHHRAIELAVAAEDYKAIPALTVPVLDRIVPKRDQNLSATQVNITLSLKQSALLDADPIIDVTSEAIPAEIVDETGSPENH